MKKYIDNFESFVNKINEGFIIGNDPLENSLKGKEKLSSLVKSIDSFMEFIVKEMDNDQTEDYDEEAYNLASDIKKFGEDAKLLSDGISEYLDSKNNNS